MWLTPRQRKFDDVKGAASVTWERWKRKEDPNLSLKRILRVCASSRWHLVGEEGSAASMGPLEQDAHPLVAAYCDPRRWVRGICVCACAVVCMPARTWVHVLRSPART